jgi:hypothetical protein
MVLFFVTITLNVTTHFLQPLDVSVFDPMKQRWKSKVVEHIEQNGVKPTIQNFMELFVAALQKCAINENIQSGFKITGIFPMNRKAIPEDVSGPEEDEC